MLPLGVAAIKYFNKSKITSAAEVKVFVMLIVPQSAHPKEKHTNKGDVENQGYLLQQKQESTGARASCQEQKASQSSGSNGAGPSFQPSTAIQNRPFPKSSEKNHN